MTNSLFGIFGGTFDPIHNGHLSTVLSIQEKCELEWVHFVPAAIPPHRNQPTVNARQRAEMVTLAVANHWRVDMDDRELIRDTPSYTYDTVKSLQSEFPSRRYCLILGVDALSDLESWYRWQELLDSIHFIVMGRPGWMTPDPLPRWWQQAQVESIIELKIFESGRIYPVGVDPSPVSSTEIRYGISQGVDVSSMMPTPVWDYICTNKLYGA